DIAAISARAHALAAGRGTTRAAEAEEEGAGEGAPAATYTLSGSTVGRLAKPAANGSAARAGTTAAGEPAQRAAQAPGAAAARAAGAAAMPSADPGARSLPDETLRDIYARETAAHIATVRAFLKREASLPEPHLLPEEVYRACHTLSGSSKMPEPRHGIRLAEPLDHWLRRAFASGAGLGGDELTLLQDCMAAMEAWAPPLDEPTGSFFNHWQLLERIERADKNLDQRIAAAAAQAAPGAAAAADTPAGTELGDEAGHLDPG